MQGEWIRRVKAGVSVVFVHGILSSGESCWKHPNGTYWPALLSEEPEFESLGVYVYTYQTDFTSGSYSLSDVVDDLKERLIILDQVLTTNNRIIFVCHSMGGIVVRKFLVERVQDLIDRQIMVGLYLVASPSLGSEYANWLELIAKFAGHSQAKALRFSQDNQWLNDLDKTFQNLKESGRLPLQGKELLEDKFITLKGFWRKQVVERFSGARYFGESIKIAGSDHFSIAKPSDKKADQHRLLLDFIRRILPSNHSLAPIPNGRKSSEASIAFDNSTQSRQKKLEEKLIEQLKRKDLSQVVTLFSEALKKSNSLLGTDIDSIAQYLVSGQGDRHLHIAQFLTAVRDCNPSNFMQEPVEELLSYLLQTLVRKDREETDQGLTRILLDTVHIVKLVIASRTSTPYLPNKTEEDFRNGRQSAEFQNIGHYFVVTGEFDETKCCEKIALDLLLSLGERIDPKDLEHPIESLAGALRAYRDRPENAPLQALYIEHNAERNSRHIDVVANLFYQRIGNLLWFYVYGGDQSDDWLYASEKDIDGLVHRYERDIKPRLKSFQSEFKHETDLQSKESVNTTPASIVSGSINTINYNYANQENIQIGQGNVIINQADILQLQTSLNEMMQIAQNAADINKQQYAEISSAVAIIKQEIQKHAADRNTLNQAKKILEALKDIASIAGSVASILKHLSLFG